MTPHISVIIPTFGRQQQMQKAVLSVVSQECDVPFEVIVIDDNPRDSSLRRENSAWLANCDDRIRHVENRHAKGGGGARNTGIEEARGEWVAFLDDDDEWLPGKLQKQANRAASVQTDVSCIDTGFLLKNEWSGQTKNVLPVMQGDIFESLLVKHKGRAPKLSTLMCRRSALVEAGMFDTEMRSRQDLDLYLRLARKHRFDSILEPLAIKNVHKGARISSNLEKKIDGFARYYDKYRQEFAVRPQLHRIFLRQYSRWHWRSGNRLSAVRLLWRSLFV